MRSVKMVSPPRARARRGLFVFIFYPQTKKFEICYYNYTMSTWFKPLVAFAVGLVLGVGGMYAAGIRPEGLPVVEGVPDVAGLSGAGLALIKDNQAVINADLLLNLTGTIEAISDNKLIISNGSSPSISVVIENETAIYEPPAEGSDQIVNLTVGDLGQDELVQIFGRLEGNEVVAESIIRQSVR